MQIAFENIVIRTAEVSDVKTLCNWYNDGKVMEHAGFSRGLNTNEKAVEQLLNDQFNHLCMIEIDKIDIGELNYRVINDETCSFGIKICDSRMQNKGYGTKIICLMLDYLFDELGFLVVQLNTNLDNQRAQAVYEKIGFIKIATNINSWKNQDGCLQSSVDYQLEKSAYTSILQGK